MRPRTPQETQAIAEWRNHNANEIRRNYQGQYVAYGAKGPLATGETYQEVTTKADNTDQGYMVEWIPPTTGDACFYWLKFYGLQKESWEPWYEVDFLAEETEGKNPIEQKLCVLVDSGAEIGLMGKRQGQELGFTLGRGEIPQIGQGVAGSLEYVIREIELNIGGNKFKAPFAWVVGDTLVPLLLGREVVFDLFDILFVQAEKRIEFQYRKT